MNYYERYCGDYARDTALLSLAEHGAYTLMLDYCYSTEEPLPSALADLDKLCRAKGKLEEMAVAVVAARFFPVGPDGCRHNPRVDREIAKAQPRIASSRANGSKGGRPAKPNRNPLGYPTGNPAANPMETRQQTHAGEASPTPAPSTTTPRTKNNGGAPSALPPWLPTEAWDSWRRHRGAKLTKEAITRQINKLDALRQMGHDPAAMINLAIESGWATFYPPHGESGKGGGRTTINDGIWGEQRSDDDAIDGTAERVG